jgi:hypothetical protein
MIVAPNNVLTSACVMSLLMIAVFWIPLLIFLGVISP